MKDPTRKCYDRGTSVTSNSVKPETESQAPVVESHSLPAAPPNTEQASADCSVREATKGPLQWLFSQAEKNQGRGLSEARAAASFSDRVSARLIQAETREPEVSYQNDIRCAWHIVSICDSGEAVMCTPAVLAWYRTFGCHPEHVWPRIQARRQAMLGNPTFGKFKPSARRGQTAEPAGEETAHSPQKPSPVSIPRKDKLA